MKKAFRVVHGDRFRGGKVGGRFAGSGHKTWGWAAGTRCRKISIDREICELNPNLNTGVLPEYTAGSFQKYPVNEGEVALAALLLGFHCLHKLSQNEGSKAIGNFQGMVK
ncbi:hypothetical protein [Blastopirellula marina]|uniref:hypothetical protein n=1 Tax=Blastopirellula marina TaxID=124 RepID=UPI0011B068D5|nr:hypothetical protein [Blastopirellula marina]